MLFFPLSLTFCVWRKKTVSSILCVWRKLINNIVYTYVDGITWLMVIDCTLFCSKRRVTFLISGRCHRPFWLEQWKKLWKHLANLVKLLHFCEKITSSEFLIQNTCTAWHGAGMLRLVTWSTVRYTTLQWPIERSSATIATSVSAGLFELM